MTIDFNTMESQVIPNFKGGPKEMWAQMFRDDATLILHAKLAPGAGIGAHRHEGNAEILFVVRGEGTITDDGVASPLKAGQCTYCPEGHTHSLTNTGTEELEFYAVVPKQ